MASYTTPWDTIRIAGVPRCTSAVSVIAQTGRAVSPARSAIRFFGDPLPEGDKHDAAAQALGLSRPYEFALLNRFCSEVAGAVHLSQPRAELVAVTVGAGAGATA